jgi:hypothetical protein
LSSRESENKERKKERENRRIGEERRKRKKEERRKRKKESWWPVSRCGQWSVSGVTASGGVTV